MTVYYKMRHILLQNATAILLQIAAEVYCRMRQAFYYKIVTVITKSVNFITK